MLLILEYNALMKTKTEKIDKDNGKFKPLLVFNDFYVAAIDKLPSFQWLMDVQIKQKWFWKIIENISMINRGSATRKF